MSGISSPGKSCTYEYSFRGSPIPGSTWTPTKTRGFKGSFSWVYARFLRTVCGNQIQIQSNRFLQNASELPGTIWHCYVTCGDNTQINVLWCFPKASESLGKRTLQKKINAQWKMIYVPVLIEREMEISKEEINFHSRYGRKLLREGGIWASERTPIVKTKIFMLCEWHTQMHW